MQIIRSLASVSLCLSVIGPVVTILNQFDETFHGRFGPENYDTVRLEVTNRQYFFLVYPLIFTNLPHL